MNLHWSQCNFVVVDVEGNGQTPQEIIELAVVHIRDACILNDRFDWLLQPEKSVTTQASRVHGIYDSDLIGKPKFQEVAFDIQKALGNFSVIGHNVTIDVQLLKAKLPSWQPIVAIDTLKLAKWVLPGLPSYALEAVIRKLDIKSEKQVMHRAYGDAFATAEIFLKLANMLEKHGALDFRALVEISASARDPYFKTSQKDLF